MIEEHEIEKIRGLLEDGDLDHASAMLKHLVSRAPKHEELRVLRAELRCHILARTVAIAS